MHKACAWCSVCPFQRLLEHLLLNSPFLILHTSPVSPQHPALLHATPSSHSQAPSPQLPRAHGLPLPPRGRRRVHHHRQRRQPQLRQSAAQCPAHATAAATASCCSPRLRRHRSAAGGAGAIEARLGAARPRRSPPASTSKDPAQHCDIHTHTHTHTHMRHCFPCALSHRRHCRPARNGGARWVLVAPGRSACPLAVPLTQPRGMASCFQPASPHPAPPRLANDPIPSPFPSLASHPAPHPAPRPTPTQPTIPIHKRTHAHKHTHAYAHPAPRGTRAPLPPARPPRGPRRRRPAPSRA
mgnify:CR=1 FL=1